MSGWQQHLPIFPIVLPLLTAALLLLLRGEARRPQRAMLAVLAMLAQLATAGVLFAMAEARLPAPWPGEIGVYALGGWVAPVGIVLVVDRLSTLLLLLTATLGLAALVYSLARWSRVGVYYLPLFQCLMLGLNGAFLTGDLFNLFVFFEIMLTASYGLALHGSGLARIRAAVHYIVINLVASLLFLIAAALIYGVTGTLNMADLARQVPMLAAADRALFDTGAALLGIVFLVKAGSWPLNFWLPAAYGAAAAPVAAIFAILTKVGIYALLRFETLLHASDAPAPFEGQWLFYCGLATIATGTLGVLAAQRLDRLASFLVIISSGALLAAFGFNGTSLTGPALFYLVNSVLGSGAFFLVIELAERDRSRAADLLAVSFDYFGGRDPEDPRHSDEVVGVAIPLGITFLGFSFIVCTLLLIGLPPLSGFIAKFALLSTAVAAAPDAANTLAAWLLVAALLLSGLAGLITASRLGIRVFWDSSRKPPRLQWLEAGPVAALMALCIVLAMAAGPAMRYFNVAARSLHDGRGYVESVLPIQIDSEGQRP